jgi:tetratricopeptide (TPR) repeat protein
VTRWQHGAMALLLAAAAASAQDDVSRTQVEQRLKLADALIGDEAAMRRIAASARPEAIASADEARVHLAAARDLLVRGDLAAARTQADEALRHIGQARRLVPDSPARQNAARQRYEQLQPSLDRLVEAWRARATPAQAADGDMAHAAELIDTARSFGRERRFEEAVHTLRAAEGHVLAGMNRLLHATTLDYTARAATPAEELQLELARHQSLSDLVPIALSDLKPPADAVVLIERYQESSQALRGQAMQSAQRGQTEQALSHIRNATLFLQRALGAAGVVTPAPTGSTP